MRHFLLLSAVCALFGVGNAASPDDVDPAFPGQAQCPLIPQGSTSPSTFACAMAGTGACCTQKNGIAVLATQWIPNRGPAEEFTLHGLWPNTCSNARTGENGCDSARQYSDIEALLEPALLADMNKYWPTKFSDNNDFWAHEWGKHGTCVTTLNPECFKQSPTYRKGMEVNNYFKASLQLRQKYELYRVLKKNGIVATLDKSRWRTTDEVSAAIKREYGVDVQIKCQSGLIFEIIMYFAAQGQGSYVPIDVPSNLRHSCGKAGSKIGLPPKKMTPSELEELKRTIGYDVETQGASEI